MYYIYILRSKKIGNYYVGHTDQPERRLLEHNTYDRNTFTSKYRPWQMVALFECGQDRGVAIKIERFIKKQKSRTLIERMVEGYELNGVLAQLVRVPHMRD